jgi:predicted nucleic acid-binding protein
MIVDASAFIAALGTPRAASAFRGSDVTAPDLIIAEVLNGLWKVARAGFSVPDRATVIALLDKIRILPSRPYATRAAEIADEFDHPVYDCLYVAVAEAQADTLLTVDARLSRKFAKSRLKRRVRLLKLG